MILKIKIFIQEMKMKKILKEDIKNIEKKKKDLKDFILKIKQSLKSISENKNY